jgi:hypothetical protein
MREGVGIDYQRQLLSCDIGHRFKRDYESAELSKSPGTSEYAIAYS